MVRVRRRRVEMGWRVSRMGSRRVVAGKMGVLRRMKGRGKGLLKRVMGVTSLSNFN
jgi:hypothetical protein